MYICMYVREGNLNPAEGRPEVRRREEERGEKETKTQVIWGNSDVITSLCILSHTYVCVLCVATCCGVLFRASILACGRGRALQTEQAPHHKQSNISLTRCQQNETKPSQV